MVTSIVAPGEAIECRLAGPRSASQRSSVLESDLIGSWLPVGSRTANQTAARYVRSRDCPIRSTDRCRAVPGTRSVAAPKCIATAAAQIRVGRGARPAGRGGRSGTSRARHRWPRRPPRRPRRPGRRRRRPGASQGPRHEPPAPPAAPARGSAAARSRPSAAARIGRRRIADRPGQSAERRHWRVGSDRRGRRVARTGVDRRPAGVAGLSGVRSRVDRSVTTSSSSAQTSTRRSTKSKCSAAV